MTNDYYIWETLAPHFQPNFICIEYNSVFGPEEEFLVPYDENFVWARDDYYGASYRPLVALGRKLGYELIHCASAGDNLFFAHHSIASRFTCCRGPEFYQLPQYGRNGRAPNGKGARPSKKNTTLLERVWFYIRYRVMWLPRVLATCRARLAGNYFLTKG